MSPQTVKNIGLCLTCCRNCCTYLLWVHLPATRSTLSSRSQWPSLLSTMHGPHWFALLGKSDSWETLCLVSDSDFPEQKTARWLVAASQVLESEIAITTIQSHFGERSVKGRTYIFDNPLLCANYFAILEEVLGIVCCCCRPILDLRNRLFNVSLCVHHPWIGRSFGR